MKTIVVVLMVSAFLAGNAQKMNQDKVPASVIAAFSKDHPSVKVDEWEKEKNNFEAEYKMNGRDHSVVYDAKGELVESEDEIAPDDLPEAARQYIVKNYKNARVKEAARITSASGVITFEADLGKQDLLFDNSGKFITIEKESADDKN
jgi:hypothetical protein